MYRRSPLCSVNVPCSYMADTTHVKQVAQNPQYYTQAAVNLGRQSPWRLDKVVHKIMSSPPSATYFKFDIYERSEGPEYSNGNHDGAPELQWTFTYREFCTNPPGGRVQGLRIGAPSRQAPILVPGIPRSDERSGTRQLLPLCFFGVSPHPLGQVRSLTNNLKRSSVAVVSPLLPPPSHQVESTNPRLRDFASL